MRWPFSTKKGTVDPRSRDAMRDLKVLDSQRALLEAATATADAANFVTTRLKAKLEDSMAQIESTARILNDALVICDLDGKIQAFNPAAERMFGLNADDVRDTFVGALFKRGEVAFEKGEEIWGLLTNLDIAEEDGDLNGLNSDGSLFPLDVNHTRLDRSDGSSIMLLILRNATESVVESTKLKNYRSIFEGSFDGILVVENQQILAANSAATNLFGYKVEDLLSKSLDMLFIVRPHVSVEAIEQRGEGKHHDGHLMELFFTTTTIFWNGFPASLITIKNISPSEGTISSENMICCFDVNFLITFANNAFSRFYGTKRERLIGMDIRKLMPSEECNPFLINVSRLTPIEPTRKMQLCSTSDSGEQRLQSWTDHVSYDEMDVEYQRVGHCTITTKDSPES